MHISPHSKYWSNAAWTGILLGVPGQHPHGHKASSGAWKDLMLTLGFTSPEVTKRYIFSKHLKILFCTFFSTFFLEKSQHPSADRKCVSCVFFLCKNNRHDVQTIEKKLYHLQKTTKILIDILQHSVSSVQSLSCVRLFATLNIY